MDRAGSPGANGAGPRWYEPALPQFGPPDSGIVTIRAAGYDLTQPWFASVKIRVERPYASPTLINRGLLIGPVGTVEGHVRQLLKGRFTERLSGRGGQFLVGRSDVDGHGLVAWQGRWNEVYGWVNQPDVPTSQMLRLFDRLTFRDSRLGVRVVTRAIPKETLYAIEITKHVPGVGFLFIHKGNDAAELLPRWSGARVRSGEVWRKNVALPGNAGEEVLVHASSSAVTVLYSEQPVPAASASRDTVRLDFLDQLEELSWV